MKLASFHRDQVVKLDDSRNYAIHNVHSQTSKHLVCCFVAEEVSLALGLIWHDIVYYAQQIVQY